MQQLLAKNVIYNNWDNRFQADKPASAARLDKFAWFLEAPELSRAKDIFLDNIKHRANIISKEFLSSDESVPSFKNFSTIAHYLETYDE